MRDLRKVNDKLTSNFDKFVPDTALSFYNACEAIGWSFAIVHQTRGHCYYSSKTVTVPAWAMLKGREYYHWYIAHELAHIKAPSGNHDATFMQALKELCPAESLKHELSYKPREAFKAGIFCLDF